MSEEQLTSALNIMRRMPPSKIEQSLSGLINLVPEMTDDLLQRVDQPLQVAVDSKTSRQYLLCDYNRDGDSYRSFSSLLHYTPFFFMRLSFFLSLQDHHGQTNMTLHWKMDSCHLLPFVN